MFEEIHGFSDFIHSSEVKEALETVKAAFDFISGTGFLPKFPIIENPSTAIGLLLGKDVDQVKWSLPKLNLDVPIYLPVFPGFISGRLRGVGRLGGRL